ncbi:MAG TPA: alpha/beta fold hydrolase [Mycobacteriales bacterium]|jgi:pimeloyl-ACP methyl ester carboxylesterase|nr:alpha/beta fold hydrolase [Mycobacteriales bacterium]
MRPWRSVGASVGGDPVPAAAPAEVPLPEVDPNRPPYPAETVLIDGRGVLMRATPSGTPEAEPALYVHGLGGSSTNWTDLGALLADHVDGVAMDLPGFGGSDPAAGEDYSLAAHARVVARVIEERGRGPLHLLANSLGGAVSLLVAADRPELVRTLTLISPAMPDLRPRRSPAVLIGAFAVPGLRQLADRYTARSSIEDRVRAVLRACFADPTLVPETRFAEAVAEQRRQVSLPWAQAAFAGSVRGLVRSYLRSGSGSLWQVAGRITAPTLVIWGAGDRLVDPVLAPRTARAIPGARLTVLPDVGHTAHLEAPRLTAELVLGLLQSRPGQGCRRAPRLITGR